MKVWPLMKTLLDNLLNNFTVIDNIFHIYRYCIYNCNELIVIVYSPDKIMNFTKINNFLYKRLSPIDINIYISLDYLLYHEHTRKLYNKKLPKTYDLPLISIILLWHNRYQERGSNYNLIEYVNIWFPVNEPYANPDIRIDPHRLSLWGHGLIYVIV